jgi:hypothetical protein
MKRLLLLTACVSVLAGCVPHFKEMDSYNTQFQDTYSQEDSVKPLPNTGDPYSFGGIAEGSGGLMARQSYATDNQAPDFRDATETGKMGEIANDRTPTPDPRPGPALPGTQGGSAGTTIDLGAARNTFKGFNGVVDSEPAKTQPSGPSTQKPAAGKSAAGAKPAGH